MTEGDGRRAADGADRPVTAPVDAPWRRAAGERPDAPADAVATHAVANASMDAAPELFPADSGTGLDVGPAPDDVVPTSVDVVSQEVTDR